MIKARATIGTSDSIIIGLSRTNVERLLNNQPIMFPASHLMLTEVDKVVIIGGETEAEIYEDLRSIGVTP